MIGDNHGPIPHAHVALRGSDAEAIADDEGIFALRVPQEGTLAAEHPVWVEFARAMAPMANIVPEGL